MEWSIWSGPKAIHKETRWYQPCFRHMRKHPHPHLLHVENLLTAYRKRVEESALAFHIKATNSLNKLTSGQIVRLTSARKYFKSYSTSTEDNLRTMWDVLLLWIINKQIYGPGNRTKEYRHVGISGRRLKVQQTLIWLSWKRKRRQLNANEYLNWTLFGFD